MTLWFRDPCRCYPEVSPGVLVLRDSDNWDRPLCLHSLFHCNSCHHCWVFFLVVSATLFSLLALNNSNLFVLVGEEHEKLWGKKPSKVTDTGQSKWFVLMKRGIGMGFVKEQEQSLASEAVPFPWSC